MRSLTITRSAEGEDYSLQLHVPNVGIDVRKSMHVSDLACELTEAEYNENCLRLLDESDSDDIALSATDIADLRAWAGIVQPKKGTK